MSRLLAFYASTLIFGLQACSTAPVTAHPHPPQPPHIGAQHMTSQLDGDWKLIAANGIDVRDVKLTIRGSDFSLNAGCNTMMGMIHHTSQNRIQMQMGGSTLMACPDNYDERLAYMLNGIQQIQHTQNQLTLLSSLGNLMFEKIVPVTHLAGEWIVRGLNINNGVVSSIHQPRQTLFFDNGRLRGNDGCNQIAGEYRIDGDQIQMSSVAMTRRACQFRDGNAWDRAFHSALERARHIEITQSGFNLRGERGDTLMSLSR